MESQETVEMFVSSCGRSLEFSMKICPEKAKLDKLIPAWGGCISAMNTGPHTIRLVPKDNTDISQCGDSFHVQYIYDCIEAEKLLFLDNYRANKSCYDGKISAMDVMMRKRSWADCVRTREPSVNRVDQDSTSSYQTIQTDSSKTLKRTAFSKRGYLPSEQKAMLKYIIENKKYREVKGRLMWVEMAKAEVCPGRTWQSMKEHYQKSIVPNLHQFKVPVGVAKQIYRAYSNSRTLSEDTSFSDDNEVLERQKTRGERNSEEEEGWTDEAEKDQNENNSGERSVKEGGRTDGEGGGTDEVEKDLNEKNDGERSAREGGQTDGEGGGTDEVEKDLNSKNDGERGAREEGQTDGEGGGTDEVEKDLNKKNDGERSARKGSQTVDEGGGTDEVEKDLNKMNDRGKSAREGGQTDDEGGGTNKAEDLNKKNNGERSAKEGGQTDGERGGTDIVEKNLNKKNDGERSVLVGSQTEGTGGDKSKREREKWKKKEQNRQENIERSQSCTREKGIVENRQNVEGVTNSVLEKYNTLKNRMGVSHEQVERPESHPRNSALRQTGTNCTERLEVVTPTGTQSSVVEFDNQEQTQVPYRREALTGQITETVQNDLPQTEEFIVLPNLEGIQGTGVGAEDNNEQSQPFHRIDALVPQPVVQEKQTFSDVHFVIPETEVMDFEEHDDSQISGNLEQEKVNNVELLEETMVSPSKSSVSVVDSQQDPSTQDDLVSLRSTSNAGVSQKHDSMKGELGKKTRTSQEDSQSTEISSSLDIIPNSLDIDVRSEEVVSQSLLATVKPNQAGHQNTKEVEIPLITELSQIITVDDINQMQELLDASETVNSTHGKDGDLPHTARELKDSKHKSSRSEIVFTCAEANEVETYYSCKDSSPTKCPSEPPSNTVKYNIPDANLVRSFVTGSESSSEDECVSDVSTVYFALEDENSATRGAPTSGREGSSPTQRQKRPLIQRENRDPIQRKNRALSRRESRALAHRENRAPIQRENRSPIQKESRTLQRENGALVQRESRALIRRRIRAPISSDSTDVDSSSDSQRGTSRAVVQHRKNKQRRANSFHGAESSSTSKSKVNIQQHRGTKRSMHYEDSAATNSPFFKTKKTSGRTVIPSCMSSPTSEAIVLRSMTAMHERKRALEIKTPVTPANATKINHRKIKGAADSPQHGWISKRNTCYSEIESDAEYSCDEDDYTETNDVASTIDCTSGRYDRLYHPHTGSRYGRGKTKMSDRAAKSGDTYSYQEDMRILAYIDDHKAQQFVGGRELWQVMERRKVVPNRSWHSMKERYRKRILPRLHQYIPLGLSKKTLTNFETFIPIKLEEPKPEQNHKVWRPYTYEEEKMIVQFIVVNERYHEVGSKSMWQAMSLKVPGLQQRTWLSLKERFRKHIINNLHKFKLTKQEVKNFKNTNIKSRAPSKIRYKITRDKNAHLQHKNDSELDSDSDGLKVRVESPDEEKLRIKMKEREIFNRFFKSKDPECEPSTSGYKPGKNIKPPENETENNNDEEKNLSSSCHSASSDLTLAKNNKRKRKLFNSQERLASLSPHTPFCKDGAGGATIKCLYSKRYQRSSNSYEKQEKNIKMKIHRTLESEKSPLKSEEERDDKDKAEWSPSKVTVTHEGSSCDEGNISEEDLNTTVIEKSHESEGGAADNEGKRNVKDTNHSNESVEKETDLCRNKSVTRDTLTDSTGNISSPENNDKLTACAVVTPRQDAHKRSPGCSAVKTGNFKRLLEREKSTCSEATINVENDSAGNEKNVSESGFQNLVPCVKRSKRKYSVSPERRTTRQSSHFVQSLPRTKIRKRVLHKHN